MIKIKHPPLSGFEEQQKLKIFVNGEFRTNAIFAIRWKVQQDGLWVLFPGSSLNCMPELGKIRSKNSAKELGIEEGDVITWEVV